MPQPHTRHGIEGLPEALAAHAIWGVMPIYLILVRTVPPVEFVAWRILFTLPVCLVILAWRGGGGEIRRALANRRTLAALLGSALMIGINWVLYVVAIQTGHVYAASLGYYILPLIMMLLGLAVLREKLTRAQWCAVSLAGVGVALLAAGALNTLALSLSMAATFALYGLIRKTADVGALAGLTLETLLLLPPAILVTGWYALQPAGSAIAQGSGVAAAVALGGPMTAVPLMLFASATRKMNYSMVGFLQFLSPTIVFLLGLLWFGEELRPAQLGCFVLIWCAMALFVWDLMRSRVR